MVLDLIQVEVLHIQVEDMVEIFGADMSSSTHTY